MPSICQFNGIMIYMYFLDHAPPHFHAIYQGQQIVVGIDPAVILQGTLPVPQQTRVLQWARKRKHELLANWTRAQASPNPLPLQQVQP